MLTPPEVGEFELACHRTSVSQCTDMWHDDLYMALFFFTWIFSISCYLLNRSTKEKQQTKMVFCDIIDFKRK